MVLLLIIAAVGQVVTPSKPAEIALTCNPAKGVITPDETPPLIIPQPKTNELKFDKPLDLTGQYDFPAGRVRFWDSDFIIGMQRRFEMPLADKKGKIIHVDGGVSKLGYHAGGYQITITQDSISVLGEEDEGYHNGLRRLALLAFPHGGRVALPTGYLSANPQLAWRGVHLFVGPEARSFQKKLWNRVLLPLGFNNVVLQCERTAWDCVPNLQSAPNTMSKPDLAGLFSDYRAMGIEPIPLIQSFGHMEWFFEKSQSLDLAVNPKIPYTIDPRQTGSKEKLGAIWDEACDLLKPKVVHFGCDEVDMRGFPKDDASLVTELWSMQMPLLKAIADKHEAQMMLWGDEGLAPGEAIDATNGNSKEESGRRRAAIPKGAWIADWHYKPEARIESFLPSLQLWKKEGFHPIASAWLRPENVRSMDLAADVEKCGTLQTTWAGYFSNENNIVEHMDQFTAMVLAADYSWSTRYDSVSRIGYDPTQVFRQMYFGQPRPVVPVAGIQAFKGAIRRNLTDRDMRFVLGDPVLFRSSVTSPQAPSSVDLKLTAKGRHVAIVLNAQDQCDEGEVLANLTIKLVSGKVLPVQVLSYGRQVRTSGDGRAMPWADRIDGLSIFEFQLPVESELRNIHIETVSPRGGLEMHGLIVW